MPEMQIQGTWNNDFSNVHARMKVAVESFLNADSLADRLGNALHTMSLLREDEFPEELREEYRFIIAECSSTETPIGHENVYDATIRRMGPRKKRELATKIVELYDRITKDYVLPDSLWPYASSRR